MQHVIGSQKNANLLARGHHHRIVHFQKIVLPLGRSILDLVPGRGQIAQETDALPFPSQVVITPFPLITRRLDRDVRVGGVLHRNHSPGRGKCHPHQNQKRNRSPEDLNRGAVVKIGRLVSRRLAMLDHGVKHHPKHPYEYHQANP